MKKKPRSTKPVRSKSPLPKRIEVAPAKRILAFYRAIEFFAPPNLPKVDPESDDGPVFEVGPDDPLPWEPDHELQERDIPDHKTWRYTLFGNVFAVAGSLEVLDSVFGVDPNVYDERTDNETAMFGLQLNSRGQPLIDTFVVSACIWATSRTIHPGPKAADWLDGFDNFQQDIQKIFQKIRDGKESEVTDAKTETGESSNIPAGPPLSTADLIQFNDALKTELKLPDGKFGTGLRVRCSLIQAKFDNESEDTDFLNSFFLNDLKKVGEAVGKGDWGPGLQQLMTFDEAKEQRSRVDVRRNTDLLFDALMPTQLPPACWPSPGHHSLVCSQQFAVNKALESLSESSGLFAVNGPPGTGKTTLLRDLVAAIVYLRAKRLSGLKSPGDAFGAKLKWKFGNSDSAIVSLRDDLRLFGIVIASTNNGAVENVSLEIPNIGAVDPFWLQQPDPFRDFGTRVLGQPAWALIAARLGNKKNRGEFVNRFFFGKKNPSTDATGTEIPSLLEWFAKPGGDVDWPGARKRFLECERLVLKLKQRRQDEVLSARKSANRISDARREAGLLRQKLEQLFSLRRRAKALVKEMRGYRRWLGSRARLALLHFDRLELRAYRISERTGPGTGRSVGNGAGKKSSRSRDRMKMVTMQLANSLQEFEKFQATAAMTMAQAKLNCHMEMIKSAETGFRAQQRILSQRIETHAVLIKQISSDLSYCRREIGDLEDKCNLQMSGELKIDLRMSRTVRLIQNWSDDTIRERSVPWRDRELHLARSQLFIESLKLHRVLITSCATDLSSSMYTVLSVINGKVPSEVDPEIISNAWNLLFLLLPVISTTFASYDRMFKGLGGEGLGWLLIDESGQATPQAATGAIWRAKKIVVVGDPMQLPPVVTLPVTAENSLQRHFNVHDDWRPCRWSLQEMADRVSKWGTAVSCCGESVWVGAPLRLHRRCDSPMLQISNEISYDGLMIDGVPRRERLVVLNSKWSDVSDSVSHGHWIPEEGKRVDAVLDHCRKHGIEPEQIFLISPFRDVAKQLGRYERRYPGMITGTIHTAQGKERDIVILVLGGDPAMPGAKTWAAKKPNLLNVAVSRARRRLYVIGNKSAWGQQPYFCDCLNILDDHARQAGKIASKRFPDAR